MAKIPKSARRKPGGEHVRKHHAYRERTGKPKATLSSSRGGPLTFERYLELMKDYSDRAFNDIGFRKQIAAQNFSAMNGVQSPKNEGQRMRAASSRDRAVQISKATVSPESTTYPIAKEIIKDFRRTKGLKVFGYGVGYGQLLFFLKNFMGAKTKGVDLGEFSKEMTKRKGLSVTHNKDAADPRLRKKGKFDVTYSVYLLEPGPLRDEEKAHRILDNMAEMTKKGGKSYHVTLSSEPMFSKADAIKRGFRVEEWRNLYSGGSKFIKLTKVRD